MAILRGCYQWNETLKFPRGDSGEFISFEVTCPVKKIYASIFREKIENITLQFIAYPYGDALGILMLRSDGPLGNTESDIVLYQTNIVIDDTEQGIENAEVIFNQRLPFFNNRLIDFGEEGIEVDDTFYNWFLENSITIENFEAAIAQNDVQIFGKWLWNNVIPIPFDENFIPESNSIINFSAMPFGVLNNILVAETNYIGGGFQYNNSESYYEAFLEMEGSTGSIICYTNNQWIDPTTLEPSEEYQTWDFGDQGVWASKQDLEFLEANATPIEQEETTILSGCYQWKTNLSTTTKLIEKGKLNANINYNIATQSILDCRRLVIAYDEATGININAISNNQSIELFNPSTGWDEDYNHTRLINFGLGGVTVGVSFAEFIEANAEKVDWNEVINANYTSLQNRWQLERELSADLHGMKIITPIEINGKEYTTISFEEKETKLLVLGTLSSGAEEILYCDQWCEPIVYENVIPETTVFNGRSSIWNVKENVLLLNNYYTLFIANAEQAQELKGCYLWKENITIPSKALNAYVNFRSYLLGQSIKNFDSLTIDTDKTVTYYVSTESFTNVFNSDAAATYLIDFGEEIQYVPISFYTYLRENAQTTTWDFVASKELYILSNKWILNEVLELGSFIYNAPLIAGGQVYRNISINPNGDIVAITAQNAEQLFYTADGGWLVDEKNKKWDFGNRIFYISKKEYEYFMENAKMLAPEDVFSISYKDRVINTFNLNQKVTLVVKGDLMEENVIITTPSKFELYNGEYEVIE